MSSEQSEPTPFEVVRESGGGAVRLAGEVAGDGPPIVLLHALSATRRNVVHGSRHLLGRGYRLFAYDARGHGESSPPSDPQGYEYAELVGDLGEVLEDLEIQRPALVGASMGATTAMAFALEQPSRVAALVQITPAYLGIPRSDGDEAADWDRLADALEQGGIERFVEVASEETPERWRDLTRQATRQRLERHRSLEAIVDALRVVPRSSAFDGLEPLERLDLPTLVVGSRDEVDRAHPLTVAREYADRLPRAELLVEEEGDSPLAWQGGRLSNVIGDFLEQAGFTGQV